MSTPALCEVCNVSTQQGGSALNTESIERAVIQPNARNSIAAGSVTC